MIGNTLSFLLTESSEGKRNIMTIMPWYYFSDSPTIIGLSIRKSRLSYINILETKKFVLSVPTKNLVKELNYCGVHSGRDVDKLKKIDKQLMVYPGFTLPALTECISNYECELVDVISLPTHDLVLGKVTAEKCLSDDEKFAPVIYYDVGSDWWCLGEKVWTFSKVIEYE